MRKFAFAAALLAGTATPALAQDTDNLGGFHVDALVGYDRANIEDEGTSGIVYGVGAGYDSAPATTDLGIETSQRSTAVSAAPQARSSATSFASPRPISMSAARSRSRGWQSLLTPRRVYQRPMATLTMTTAPRRPAPFWPAIRISTESASAGAPFGIVQHLFRTNIASNYQMARSHSWSAARLSLLTGEAQWLRERAGRRRSGPFSRHSAGGLRAARYKPSSKLK